MRSVTRINERIDRIRSFQANLNDQIRLVQEEVSNQLNNNQKQIQNMTLTFNEQFKVVQQTKSIINNRKNSIKRHTQQLRKWNETKVQVLKVQLQANKAIEGIYDQMSTAQKQGHKIEQKVMVLNSNISEKTYDNSEMLSQNSNKGINNSMIQNGSSKMVNILNPQTQTITLAIQRGRQLGDKLQFKLRYMHELGKFVPTQQYSTIITKIILNYNFHKDLAKLERDLDCIINQK